MKAHRKVGIPMVKRVAYIVYNITNIFLLVALGIISICFYVFLIRDQRLFFNPHEGRKLIEIAAFAQIIQIAILCFLYLKLYGWHNISTGWSNYLSDYHYFNLSVLVLGSLIHTLANYCLRNSYFTLSSVENNAIGIIFFGLVILGLLNVPAHFLYQLIIKTVTEGTD